jgi:hypothetical protein
VHAETTDEALVVEIEEPLSEDETPDAVSVAEPVDESSETESKPDESRPTSSELPAAEEGLSGA